MSKDNRRQDTIGDNIPGKDLAPGVERLADKTLTVRHGSSCTLCALSGLGHRVCPEVRCTEHNRDDGRSIVYVELK